MKKGIKYVVGIDEAGRGPLAGPIVFGFTKIYIENMKRLIRDFKKEGLTDSKKLSTNRRDVLYKMGVERKRKGELDFCVARSTNDSIDKFGLSKVIKKCIESGLKQLKCDPRETFVYLDGALRAPSNYQHQQTVIKGDLKIPVISLASIVAKVTRDTYMKNISKKYPDYNFNINKGYGTKSHREKIKKQGLSDLHRKTFCIKL